MKGNNSVGCRCSADVQLRRKKKIIIIKERWCRKYAFFFFFFLNIVTHLEGKFGVKVRKEMTHWKIKLVRRCDFAS
jgi:hypothetical protein